MDKVKMEMRCEKCGKPQPKDKERSNKSWSVFDTKAVCECGGKYCMYIDGQKVG